MNPEEENIFMFYILMEKLLERD